MGTIWLIIMFVSLVWMSVELVLIVIRATVVKEITEILVNNVLVLMGILKFLELIIVSLNVAIH